MRQNFYVFTLYRNPDQDDQIFDCLLTSMAAMQAENVGASFLFMGESAAEHHTAEQYSKIGRTKSRKHLSRSNLS